MCSPLIGIALGAAALGMQVISSKKEAQATNQAADYNASVAKQNAQTATVNAAYAEEQAKSAEYSGGVEAKQKRLEVAKTKAAQRASYAGSGVTVDSGSALDALVDTSEQGNMDALTIQYNAAQTAYAARMDAYNYTQQSAQYMQESAFQKSRKVSTGLAAGTTLLTGASSLASKIW